MINQVKRDYRDQLFTLFPLDDNSFEELFNAVSFKEIPSGTILVSEGQIATKLLIVINGCLREYFIKEDGKGFIGAHTGDDAFFDWPEFGEMIGGYFDDHPWGQFDAHVIVEDPKFAAMKPFPARFTIHDEIYQHKNFDRAKVHVLASLDATILDLKNPKVHRTDRDFPVAWIKMHGKGRVFYSTFGHAAVTWDNPQVQQMYLSAIKWALRLEGEDVVLKN